MASRKGELGNSNGLSPSRHKLKSFPQSWDGSIATLTFFRWRVWEAISGNKVSFPGCLKIGLGVMLTLPVWLYLGHIAVPSWSDWGKCGDNGTSNLKIEPFPKNPRLGVTTPRPYIWFLFLWLHVHYIWVSCFLLNSLLRCYVQLDRCLSLCSARETGHHLFAKTLKISNQAIGTELSTFCWLWET